MALSMISLVFLAAWPTKLPAAHATETHETTKPWYLVDATQISARVREQQLVRQANNSTS